MCELLAMNASHDADLDTLLTALRPRDSEVGPQADGWGVALYDGRAAHVFKEPKAVADSTSFAALQDQGFASRTILAHIRRANPPGVGRRFANTHPFERELAGRSWVFAHKGVLSDIRALPLTGFHPTGRTDSEYAFCLLLEAIRPTLPADGRIDAPDALLGHLVPAVSAIIRHGEFNAVLSDGDHLIVHAHTRLHLLERQHRAAGGEQTVALIATHPLTDDEPWACLLPNTLSLFRQGRLLAQRTTQGPASDPLWWHHA